MDEEKNTKAAKPDEHLADQSSDAVNSVVNADAPTMAAKDDDLVVGGFRFTTPEDAELARQEMKKIIYIEKNLNFHQPESVLAVYNKALDSHLFKTPLGFVCLKQLSAQMHRTGIAPGRIAPIPLHHSYAASELSETSESVARMRLERRLDSAAKEIERQKRRARNATYLVATLVFLVIAMFVITLNSDNPNIINYENALLDKYAGWEQELTEREIEIRNRERELNTN